MTFQQLVDLQQQAIETNDTSLAVLTSKAIEGDKSAILECEGIARSYRMDQERSETTLESLEAQIERMNEAIDEYKRMVIEANEDRGIMMLKVQEAEAEAWLSGARFGRVNINKSFELEQFNPFRLGGS